MPCGKGAAPARSAQNLRSAWSTSRPRLRCANRITLAALDATDVAALTKLGSAIRGLVREAPLPADVEHELINGSPVAHYDAAE